jgi:lysophospholipase L1-like esterase
MRKVGWILLFNLALLAAVELALRAAAAAGWLTLPPAGGLAGFDAIIPEANASVEQRLYRPDPNLIRRMQPNFHMVYPMRGLIPGRDETYTVDTNERGFRTASFPVEKKEGVFRIAAMGDSTTFGFQVKESEAYPQVLAAMLEQEYPGRFEVLNLGAPGYTTRQGIELLRREAITFEPDLVTFAYGTNDRFFSGAMTDDELIRLNQSPSGAALYHMREALDRTYTYRVLKLLLGGLVSRPSETRRITLSGKRRVSPEDMRRSIAAAKQLLAEKDAALVLINNDFAATDARKALQDAAAETGIPLLDMRALLDEVRHARSVQFEEKLALHPVAPPLGKTLLRVVAPRQKGIVARVSVIGRPVVDVPLNDEGRDGDQRVGDGVWSALFDARIGHKIAYSYWETTPNGLVKEFRDNSLTPFARNEVVPQSRIADIDVFGDYYLKTDGSHPDAEGHRLIAKRLYDHVLSREDVRAFLGAAPTAS